MPRRVALVQLGARAQTSPAMAATPAARVRQEKAKSLTVVNSGLIMLIVCVVVVVVAVVEFVSNFMTTTKRDIWCLGFPNNENLDGETWHSRLFDKTIKHSEYAAFVLMRILDELPSLCNKVFLPCFSQMI